MIEAKADDRSKRGKGLIFVISGPSGSGKTTLVSKLVGDKDLRGYVAKSVSVTTRTPRLREKSNKDYYFLSNEEFLRQRRRKKFLEWTRYLGYYYATPRDFVEEALSQGRSVFLSLDLQGASRIRRLYPRRAITVFIRPPSLNALRERIRARSPEADRQEVTRRLGLAGGEMLAAREYDYCLINRDLAKTFARLKKIVLKEIGVKGKII